MNAHHTPTRVEKILNRFFKSKTIVNCDRDPYLIRWYVFRTKYLSLFIHKFVRSDEDRALHDHPFGFLVIPIWQGYIEHNPAGKRRVYPFISTRLRDATYQHRVELIDNKHSWSVFFHFLRWREWGFWPKEGFIRWDKWWSDKCE